MNYLDYMVKRPRRASQLLLLIAVLLLVSPRLFSQAAVGTILGAVFDSTGGAIAGAKVTITDVERGTMRVLSTDAAGEYTAPSLLAGTYSVRAESKGFQALEHANVLLSVAANVRVDLTLMPGAQTQTVTVTEDAPAISTSDATLGGIITQQSITALPLVNRNFLQLLQMRPGIVDTPGGNGTSTSTNGRRSGADVLIVEGVTQFDLRGGGLILNGSNKGGEVDLLPLDAVAEFTTQQNGPAEYGWKDGSDINVAVKSGTNALHGSAYAFGRDASATDAKNYSPTGNGQTSQLTVEQPGFTLGGPILKNKLFFFVGSEFVRSTSINTNATTVPSAFAGLGVGSSIVDACTSIGRAAVNPLSAQIAGLPAGSCTPLPATSTFEDVIPYNFSANTTLVYPGNATISPSNNGLAKIDWSPNQYNHVSGLFFISKEVLTSYGAVQPYWGSYGVGSTEQYDVGWTWTPNSTWVNDLRVGSASNFGTQNGIDQGDVWSPTGALYATSPYALGADGVPTGYSINNGVTATSSLTSSHWGGLPSISISTGLGAGVLGGSGGGYTGPQGQLGITDKVSHIFGNHSLKFGWEEVYVFFDNSTTGDGSGTVTFTSLTNFLKGATNTGVKRTGDNEKRYRSHWHAAFFQDTWRVGKRITLTPGIRWEYFGPPSALNCAPTPACSPGIGNFNPNYPGGVEQRGGPGLPPFYNGQYDNFNPRMGVAWDIFGNGRTVLRGGIGTFSAFEGILTQVGTGVPWAATLCTATPCDGSHPANIAVNRFGTQANQLYSQTLSYTKGQLDPTWTTACTNTLVTSTCSGPVIWPVTPGACTTGIGQCAMLVPDQNMRDARSVQWNIDLQRAITNQVALDIAYVGVHGYDEAQMVDVNEPPLGAGWDASAVGTCLLPANLATQANGWKSSNCAVDAANITSSRPYAAQFPYYNYIEDMQSGAHSNYNGLQVTLTVRNFHGLNAIAGYTFSHALDDNSTESRTQPASGDPGNQNYPYGNSDMDVRNRLRFSPSYTIPGIKSPGQMLEGWTLSGVWALQNGFAWSPDDPKSVDWGGDAENADGNGGGVFQTWNYVGPKSAFNGNGITPIPCYGQLNGCTPFATAPSSITSVCMGAAQAPYATAQLKQLAIQSLTSASGACYIQKGGILTPPAFGTVGDASRGLFRGPAYQNVDMVVEKTWKFKERYSTQFRVECYNVFNQVNYAQFSGGISSPATPGQAVGSTGFGHATTSQGSMRQFQFGLKFSF